MPDYQQLNAAARDFIDHCSVEFPDFAVNPERLAQLMVSFHEAATAAQLRYHHNTNPQEIAATALR